MKRKLEIKLTKIQLASYPGNKVPITGKVDITIKRKDLLPELCFIITSRNVQPILGKDWCNRLNQIKPNEHYPKHRQKQHFICL